jgi:uncharacterized membrane protein YphA (DoxX/SURF4 family)
MRSCALSWRGQRPSASRRALPWLGLGVRLLAAGIWLVAGAAKIGGLEQFHAQVAAYDLLPGALVTPVAYGLPFVEVGLGLYLALGLLVRPAAAFACALMLVFSTAMGLVWARGLSLDCGCFGQLGREGVGLDSMIRDLGLGLPSLAMLLRPARLLSLDRRLLSLPDRFEKAPAPERRRLRRRTVDAENDPATSSPSRKNAAEILLRHDAARPDPHRR